MSKSRPLGQICPATSEFNMQVVVLNKTLLSPYQCLLNWSNAAILHVYIIYIMFFSLFYWGKSILSRRLEKLLMLSDPQPGLCLIWPIEGLGLTHLVWSEWKNIVYSINPVQMKPSGAHPVKVASGCSGQCDAGPRWCRPYSLPLSWQSIPVPAPTDNSPGLHNVYRLQPLFHTLHSACGSAWSAGTCTNKYIWKHLVL